MKGGYIIVNLKGAPLTSGTAANIPGAYAAARNAYGKPTLISGLVVGDVAYPEFYLPLVESSGNYTGSADIGGETVTISVASGDNVTVTVA